MVYGRRMRIYLSMVVFQFTEILRHLISLYPFLFLQSTQSHFFLPSELCSPRLPSQILPNNICFPVTQKYMTIDTIPTLNPWIQCHSPSSMIFYFYSSRQSLVIYKGKAQGNYKLLLAFGYKKQIHRLCILFSF